jgi:uncharacterized repeat protein (TIGR03806 family)
MPTTPTTRLRPTATGARNPSRPGVQHSSTRGSQALAALVVVTIACGTEPQQLPWPELESGLDVDPPRHCAATDSLPDRLSDHPCFTGVVPTPGPSMVPYTVGSSLWSDGLDKTRFVAIPAGPAIAVDEAGALELPPGTVVVKEFAWEGRQIETRLLSHVESGTWRMATYVWNEVGTDATRTRDGSERALGGQTWTIPRENQCTDCHTEAAGVVLGFTLAQINRDLTYPTTGRTANQIATLVNTGLLDAQGLARPDVLPSLPTPGGDEGAPVADRARAYLHANCAHCHRAGAARGSSFDLRYGTPFELSGLCNQRPQAADPFDGDGAIVVPGNAERSILVYRMEAEDIYWRMPLLGTARVDPTGVDLVRSWINALGECQE